MKKSSCMAAWILGFSMAALTGILAGCDFSAEMKLSGKTMGTTWQATIMADPWTRKSAIREIIETELAAVNQSMSVHIPDSEISRFNSHNAIHEPFEISERFQDVIRVSRTVFEVTDGAWDGTIFPLIRLWGFNTGTPVHIPDPSDIEALLKDVGFRHLRFPDARHIQKTRIPLMLDLSSIAKGYGVDRVAAVLRSRNIHRFLIEIGGEVYAAGEKKNGQSWRVGINMPDKHSSLSQIYAVVEMRDRAMATSGDYRNYIEIDGQQFSHVFDPRTGYPVSNGVVSVSVTADTCTLADGLATGLMVMGPEEGMDRIRRMNGVECLMVVRKTDGRLTQFVSDGFNTVP
ncbi:MAG: FAD:protein FMN transferase [Desulfatirhabdiaceae bacterium]